MDPRDGDVPARSQAPSEVYDLTAVSQDEVVFMDASTDDAMDAMMENDAGYVHHALISEGGEGDSVDNAHNSEEDGSDSGMEGEMDQFLRAHIPILDELSVPQPHLATPENCCLSWSMVYTCADAASPEYVMLLLSPPARVR